MRYLSRLDLLAKVSRYIMETIRHNVKDTEDYDLRLFMDLDMCILGSPEGSYKTYAKVCLTLTCILSND